MKSARQLFEASLGWLQSTYPQHQFFVERGVVWTLQKHLNQVIRSGQLSFHVFNDYGIDLGNRRRIFADLAVLDPDDTVQLAVEFKYEPSHSRVDIQPSKFPAVFWGKDGVAKDIERITEFVSKGKAKHAYSVFIDEGGHFRSRRPHAGAKWHKWEHGVWALISHASA